VTMWEFSLSSIADLKELAERLGVRINAIADVSILAQPVQAGGLAISNSLAVHPMEGCDGDSQGRPSELTLRRYERFAAGGAGLIWGEATAVVPEGRANPRQLWLNQNNKDSFAAMVKKVRDELGDIDILVNMEPGRSLMDLGGLLYDLQEIGRAHV
jgi:2,4-dienoyl-CoA reductase (NADPH2)